MNGIDMPKLKIKETLRNHDNYMKFNIDELAIVYSQVISLEGKDINVFYNQLSQIRHAAVYPTLYDAIIIALSDSVVLKNNSRKFIWRSVINFKDEAEYILNNCIDVYRAIPYKMEFTKFENKGVVGICSEVGAVITAFGTTYAVAVEKLERNKCSFFKQQLINNQSILVPNKYKNIDNFIINQY